MIQKLLGLKNYAYVAVAAALAGFAYGWHVEAQRFAEFRGGVEAAGRVAEQARTERISRELAARKEAEHALKEERDRLRRDLGATVERLRVASARGRIVQPAPARPAGAVPPDGARAAIPDGAVCYDAERLDAALRAGYDRAVERLAPLVREGAAALAAEQHWQRWARAVGSCPPL